VLLPLIPFEPNPGRFLRFVDFPDENGHFSQVRAETARFGIYVPEDNEYARQAFPMRASKRSQGVRVETFPGQSSKWIGHQAWTEDC